MSALKSCALGWKRRGAENRKKEAKNFSRPGWWDLGCAGTRWFRGGARDPNAHRISSLSARFQAELSLAVSTTQTVPVPAHRRPVCLAERVYSHRNRSALPLDKPTPCAIYLVLVASGANVSNPLTLETGGPYELEGLIVLPSHCGLFTALPTARTSSAHVLWLGCRTSNGPG